MKRPKKIAIIGAGGITCALAQNLALDHEMVIVDGDVYEPHNSTRQFPAMSKEAINANKAEYLTQQLQKQFPGGKFEHIPKYLKRLELLNNKKFFDAELIFCAVDNNESRLLTCDLAEAMEVPAILMGNETKSADAHLFIPGVYHPFEHHDFGEFTRAPFACNSDQNPAAEQTSRANFWAASLGLHIYSSYLELDDYKFMVVKSSLDTRGDSSRQRLNDFGEPAFDIPSKAA